MAGRSNGGRPSIEEQGLRRLEAATAGRPEADGRIPRLEATICDVTGEPLTVMLENNCRSIFQRLGMEEIPSDWDPTGEEPPYEGVKDGVPWFSGEVLGNFLVSSEAELYRAERLYEALAVELVKQSVVVDSIKSRLAAARRRANDELAMPGKTQMIFARRLARALEAGNIGTAEFKLLTVDQISQICEVLKPNAVVPPAVTAIMAQALAAVGSKPADVVEVGLDDGGPSADDVNQAVNSGSENFVDSSAGALDTDGADHGKNPVVLADAAESESGMGTDGVALEVFYKPPVSEKTAEVSQRLETENKGKFAQGTEAEVFCKTTGVRTVGQSTPGGRSGEDDEGVRGGGSPAESIGDSASEPPIRHDSAAVASTVERVTEAGGESVQEGREDLNRIMMPADMAYLVVERRMVSGDDREALSIPWPDMDGPHAGWGLIADLREKVDQGKWSVAQSGAVLRCLPPVLVLMDLWAEAEPAEARRQGLVDAAGVVRPLVAEAWAIGAIMMVREGMVFPDDPLALHGVYLPPRTGREGWVRQLVTRKPLVVGRRPVRLVPGVDGCDAMASAAQLATLAARWDQSVEEAHERAAAVGGVAHPEPVVLT